MDGEASSNKHYAVYHNCLLFGYSLVSLEQAYIEMLNNRISISFSNTSKGIYEKHISL